MMLASGRQDLYQVYRVGMRGKALVKNHYNYDGEFDPGSGRTLAAWIRHASRTVWCFRASESGERVSNT